MIMWTQNAFMDQNFSVMFYVLLVISLGLSRPSPLPKKYFIVIDAGSSGSRMSVFTWSKQRSGCCSLPDYHVLTNAAGEVVYKRVDKGIDTFLTNLQGIQAYLREMLDYAASEVPRSAHSLTPLYIMATAGMRRLGDEDQETIYSQVRKIVQGRYKFQFNNAQAYTLTGDEEGLFGWIAVNFILKRFPSFSDDQWSYPLTSGMIDMGGASSQVAFELTTNPEVPADLVTEFSLSQGDGTGPTVYRIYVHSYIDYGADRMRTRYEENLLFEHLKEHGTPGEGVQVTLEDPCLSAQLKLNETRAAIAYDDWTSSAATVKTYQVVITGTGDAGHCLDLVRVMLLKKQNCQPVPCAINGTLQPTQNFENRDFYGLTNIYYSLAEFMPTKESPYSYEVMWPKIQELCARNWDEQVKLLKTHSPSSYKLACFKAVFVISFLHDGISLPRTYGRLYPRKQLNEEEVQWPLGALIYLQHGKLDSEISREMLILAILVPCLLAVIASVLAAIFICRRRKQSEISGHCEPSTLSQT